MRGRGSGVRGRGEREGGVIGWGERVGWWDGVRGRGEREGGRGDRMD